MIALIAIDSAPTAGAETIVQVAQTPPNIVSTFFGESAADNATLAVEVCGNYLCADVVTPDLVWRGICQAGSNQEQAICRRITGIRTADDVRFTGRMTLRLRSNGQVVVGRGNMRFPRTETPRDQPFGPIRFRATTQPPPNCPDCPTCPPPVTCPPEKVCPTCPPPVTCPPEKVCPTCPPQRQCPPVQPCPQCPPTPQCPPCPSGPLPPVIQGGGCQSLFQTGAMLRWNVAPSYGGAPPERQLRVNAVMAAGPATRVNFTTFPGQGQQTWEGQLQGNSFTATVLGTTEAPGYKPTFTGTCVGGQITGDYTASGVKQGTFYIKR